MVRVYCYRLSSKYVEEFYQEKLPDGVLPPSNHYTVYVVNIDNPDDKHFEYSEFVILKINERKFYPILMLNISIASKYAAFFCDIASIEENFDKNYFIEMIPTKHIVRLSRVLDTL